MTQDDIICMAREAGLLAGADLTSDRNRLFTAGLERFAYLVAAAEREACAEVLDAMAAESEADGEYSGYADYYRRKAAAIRQRGER